MNDTKKAESIKDEWKGRTCKNCGKPCGMHAGVCGDWVSNGTVNVKQPKPNDDLRGRIMDILNFELYSNDDYIIEGKDEAVTAIEQLINEKR